MFQDFGQGNRYLQSVQPIERILQAIGVGSTFVNNGALRFSTESPMPETTVELIQTGPEEAELIRNLYQYYRLRVFGLGTGRCRGRWAFLHP